MATAAQTNEFARWWNSADLTQRINWYKYTHGGKIPALVEIKLTKDYIATHYGAMAAYLDHPELGKILLRSAAEGWAPEQLQAAIQQTNWWKTTTTSQREFDLLVRTDPAEATRKAEAIGAQIYQLLQQEGVLEQFSEQRISELAYMLTRNGASETDIPRMVLAEVQFGPTQPIGRLGARMTEFKQMSDQMLTPLSDQAAFDWAKKVETGAATAEGFDQYLREVAKGSWAHLADRIDAGFTVKSLLDPQIQTVAGLLERDPDSIDFRDPRFSQIIAFNDGQTTREMSVSEAGKYARSLDEFWQTQGAEAQVASFVQNLGRQFGKVAG